MIKNFNADDKLYLLRLRKNIPFPSSIFRRGKRKFLGGERRSVFVLPSLLFAIAIVILDKIVFFFYNVSYDIMSYLLMKDQEIIRIIIKENYPC